MRRFVAERPATLEVQFTAQDGTATDPSPDTATVTIARADGTPIVTAAAATNGAAAGQFTYALSAAQTASLDVLDVAWVSSLGTVRDTVEIAGGVWFEVADARADGPPLDSATKYPAARIIAAREAAEDAIEQACGCAFVPRYRREALIGDGTVSLLLPVPRLRTVRAVTIDGTALTQAELDALTLHPEGVIEAASAWPDGSDIVVAWEHGLDRPPGRGPRVCRSLAKSYLVGGAADERATSITTEDGTFSMVTAGVRGAQFSLPEVNAYVAEHRMPVIA